MIATGFEIPVGGLNSRYRAYGYSVRCFKDEAIEFIPSVNMEVA